MVIGFDLFILRHWDRLPLEAHLGAFYSLPESFLIQTKGKNSAIILVQVMNIISTRLRVFFFFNLSLKYLK